METFITEVGRQKLILVNGLDFRTEKRSINYILNSVDDSDRIRQFHALAPLLTDKGYWYGLGYSYTTGVWPQDPNYDRKQFFRSHRKYREYLMTSDDRKALLALPDKITLYQARGSQETSEGLDIRWALNKKVAASLVARNSKQTGELQIASLRIAKYKAIAFFALGQDPHVIYDHSDSDDLPF